MSDSSNHFVDNFKNNIGNYKGVMLCARPNENVGVAKEKPFVSRVDPKEMVGLNPTKKPVPHIAQIKPNPVLKRHRQWLESFKDKLRKKKEEDLIDQMKEVDKIEKVREMAANQRTRTKELKLEYFDMATAEGERQQKEPKQAAPTKQYEEESPKQKAEPKTRYQDEQQGGNVLKAVKVGGSVLTENNLKKLEEQSVKSEIERLEQQYNVKVDELQRPKSILKEKRPKEKEKPQWAYTQEDLAKKEDEELEELLQFTNNLDYDRYINDLEVRNMVSSLKKRIDELSKEDDWKKKVVERWNQDDDKSSQRQTVTLKKVDIDAQSQVSDGRSVTSEKTAKSIQTLKEQISKKEKKEEDWDKTTTVGKPPQISLEDRIAKHVADEILRNNLAMRQVHSNNSIRKILEKEAKRHLEEKRGIAEPKMVENKDYVAKYGQVDPSNLPYLHRNPAV